MSRTRRFANDFSRASSVWTDVRRSVNAAGRDDELIEIGSLDS